MSFPRKYKKYLGLLLILLLPGIFFVIFGSVSSHHFETLPYYGPKEVKHASAQGEKPGDTLYHTLPEFRFHDHNGNVVTRDTFDNQILVVEFFKEETHLKRVYMEFKEEEDIRFMSHTLNPEMNDRKSLSFYADRMGADPSNWKFVHGPEERVEELAIEGYFKESAPDTNIRELIRHPVMVLVDKGHHVRGVYDASYSEEVSRLMEEMRLLKKEADLKEYRS